MNNPASTSSGVREDLPPYKQNVYYKIRSIFPNIDAQYIKNMILNPNTYGIEDSENSEQLIVNITENLLANGADHVDLENVGVNLEPWRFETAAAYDVQAERLIGIFPDADPEYLKNYAKTNFNNPEKIHTFIEDNLIEKKYPTRDDYVKRKIFENEFNKYFTKFSAKEFLKEIPNPVQYFENINRNSQDNVLILALLLELFNNLDQSLIHKEFTSCKYNPSLTAKILEDKHNGILKPISRDSLKNLQNQVQEFSFICNRRLIDNEMNLNDSQEDLLQCEVCFNFDSPSKSSTCDNGHIFCNQCISFGTECKIADGIYHIACFANCKSSFSQKTLENVLNSKIYNILMKKWEEEAIAAAAINLESCPFCNLMVEVPEESKIFFCMNEDCKKQSCRRCKKLNHLPYECEDVLELQKARLYLEEKMTRALIRSCLNCGKEFLKSDGCNRMSCPCGSSQCYLCDKPVSNTDYKHFNGQGASRHDLCPLYSDDKYQEAQVVLEVAKITKEEILKKNPDFDEDVVTKLLPILPERAEGPHEQIPNSNQLPEHALKVAKAIAP